MIELNNISKKYREKIVLNNISFKVEKGKITSIIGPNGSGKSTLLSVISRLIPQNEGNVFLNLKSIKEYKNKELSKLLSILRQSNHLNLKLTVRELISFGRFPYSEGKLTKEDTKEIDKAIEYLSLNSIQNDYIEELSGGQRQRAFIAMVVAQNTEYILLDEPLNNLDIKHSVQIMETLKSLANNLNKTIILVMHDINFASCYSDYILTLKKGKIINYDTTVNIVKPEILKNIFEINFEITKKNGNILSDYFNLKSNKKNTK